MQRQDVPNNSPAQVVEYITDALALVETIDPPSDLREAVFTVAANLYSGKQIMLAQPQPMDLSGLGLKGH